MKIKTLLRTLFALLLIVVSCKEEGIEEIGNSAPKLSNSTVSVSEEILDTDVIVNLSASDADEDELIYSIINDEDDLFEISPVGVLSLGAGKILDYEAKTTHILTIGVTDGIDTVEAIVTINVTDIADSEVGITTANFANYSSINSSMLIAYYYFDDGSVPSVEIDGYNDDYTYQLKLVGEYTGEEYIVELTQIDAGNNMIKDKSKLASTVESVSVLVPTKESLQIDTSEVDFEVDAYTASIIEVESGAEVQVVSSDYLLGVDAGYKTYVVDTDATNFLSGTQIENYSTWAVLSQLNLNEATQFRVRPSIANYLNGIAVVLGVYDLDANKIGYITSNGSNGSSGGTYSYKFTTAKLDDLITENGEYLLRLEERTSTVDENDTGYRYGLFQKIHVSKISNVPVHQLHVR